MSALREAAQQALEALEQSETTVRYEGFGMAHREAERKHQAAIAALRAALAQEQAEPVAWLQPKTVSGHLRPDLGYETCSDADYGAFPVYTAPPKAEQAQEPVAWLYEAGTDRTLHWHKPPLYGTPLYTTPPQRQPLSGLEVERLLEQVIWSLPAARNLVRAVERAHGIIGSQIKGDSHQTLDDAMRLPRAMAQAYENGYKAGVAARDAEHQQTLALQQRSYEREIQLDVEAERERCLRLIDEHVRAVDAEDVVRAIKEGKE